MLHIQGEHPTVAFIVGGDFNARTGESNSCVGDVGDPAQKKFFYCLSRKSRDLTIDGAGKKLLQFCDVNNLVILNGAVDSESSGYFTYINCRGASVIDYVLCSPSLLPYISDFTIIPRAESYHMPLSLTLNIPHICQTEPVRVPPAVSSFHNAEFYDELSEIMLHIQGEHPTVAFIVGGDFNARTGESNSCVGDVGDPAQKKFFYCLSRKSRDLTIDGAGKKLLQFCDVNNLVILNGAVDSESSGYFTYINCRGASVIDYVLCSPSLLPYISDFTIIPRAESYHMPLSLTLNIPHICQTEPVRVVNNSIKLSKYVYSEEQKDTFCDHIAQNLCFDNITLSFDTFDILKLVNDIICSAGQCMKVELKLQKNKNQNNDSWYDDACKKLKKLLSNALTRLNRDKSNIVRNREVCRLRLEYKDLKAQKIESWKNKQLLEILEIIVSNDPSKLWRFLRKLNCGEFITNNITPDAWMAHFRKILGGETHLSTRIVLPSFRYCELLDAPFTYDELRFAIRSLKNNKASGSDGIPAEIIKLAASNENILSLWLQAFNSLYSMGEYFYQWDMSVMHTIFKNKGSKELPDNYRGIALAQILSKVYSKLLYERLKTWAYRYNKISLYQAGFRAGHSTIDNIFILDHLVNKYLSYARGSLYCAFIDFEKAFDTINRQKLWARLWQLGCSNKMIEALMSIWKNKQLLEILEIIVSNDPSKLWRFLRKLNCGEFITNNITPDTWMAHFRKILGGETHLSTRIVLPSFRYCELLDAPFTYDELRFAIRSLKNNKASGSDGIPAEIIKLAASNENILSLWLQAFNSLYSMGEYFYQWDMSVMHTIFKNKGSKELPDNYRGIALAQILSKVYSKLLYERLKTWAYRYNKISLYQAGFRAGHSTIDNIFILDHLVNKYLSYARGSLYCAFIDFEKAFDTINRQKLWARLWQLGCSNKMIEALMSMYDNVLFAIKLNKCEITQPVNSYLGGGGIRLTPRFEEKNVSIRSEEFLPSGRYQGSYTLGWIVPVLVVWVVQCCKHPIVEARFITVEQLEGRLLGACVHSRIQSIFTSQNVFVPVSLIWGCHGTSNH
ncbi:hypothetical protein B566_EDAN018816, partial [Ephemera danica]